MRKPGKKAQSQWEKEQKADDIFVEDPQEGDLVIPIMGPSGAGKSTFINTLLGAEKASVGHDLKSHTAQINHYFLPDAHRHRRIVLVDTPGFDDTTTDDREILRRIAVWLARSYNAEMKLAGVIYLHEITQTRMLGTARKNLDLFYKLCGADAARNIVLVTTKWDEIPVSVLSDMGVRRETQLREEHWRDILARGACMARFARTPASALSIVEGLLTRDALDAVQIQAELVDVDKLLAETAAGQALRYSLKDLLEVQRRMAVQVRVRAGGEVSEQGVESDERVRALLEQIRALDVPLYRKFMRWLGFLKT